MEHKSFSDMPCPIARSLEHVGEWWSILIMRDAFFGIKRFDDFQKSLGIAPNMLTRRLKGLVESGLLEKRSYSDHANRYEYVLTQRGKDFRPVLISFLAWGNKHFAPEGANLLLADADTGKVANPVLIDKKTGKEIVQGSHKIIAGPAASAGVRQAIKAADHTETFF
ncbi:MAG: helix-turn-helix transcriptional regulator [Alphaproteobacteria bacterium]|nr:helix-turn-helix transcriptional regulator [Alphaproteobacteria bacterium]